MNNNTDILFLQQFAAGHYLRTRVWGIPSPQKVQHLDKAQLRTLLSNSQSRLSDSVADAAALGMGFTELLDAESAMLKHRAGEAAEWHLQYESVEDWDMAVRSQYRRLAAQFDDHNALMGFRVHAALMLMEQTPSQRHGLALMKILRLLKWVEKPLIKGQRLLAQSQYARMQHGISSKQSYATAQTECMRALILICERIETVIAALPAALIGKGDAMQDYQQRYKALLRGEDDTLDDLAARFEALEACFCEYNFSASLRLARNGQQIENIVGDSAVA